MHNKTQVAVVTGAFSNIGSAAAKVLLERGWTVRTLTNRAPAPGDDPRIERHALRFDRDHLVDVLGGADAFINTYWIRFPYAGIGFEDAIRNIELLIACAEVAGLRRFVQVGVSNSSRESSLGYYRGKAIVDDLLRASSLPYAIVRPTLVVGPKDVLTSNIAWFVRRSPLIAVPRGEGYELQPVTIEDTARIIADCTEASGNMEVDAAGPDRMTFAEYVELLASSMGKRRKLVTVSPSLMLRSLSIAGAMLRDTVLTREELEGLEQNLLVSHEAPLGRTPVSQALATNADLYGRRYVNDTRFRFRKQIG